MPRAVESLGAGDFRARVRFDKHATTDDGAGNLVGTWVEQFVRSAAIQPVRGGEALIADRLAGLGPAIIIVRYDEDTVLITPDWRAVELKPDGTEQVFSIKDARDMETARRHVTCLCEVGSPA